MKQSSLPQQWTGGVVWLSSIRDNKNGPNRTEMKMGDWMHGWSDLMRAADKGSADRMRVLLAEGATKDMDEKDDEGGTPLMQAAYCGHMECVSVLLEAGANPRATDFDGRTAADWALDQDNKDIARMLSAAIEKANVDAEVLRPAQPQTGRCFRV